MMKHLPTGPCPINLKPKPQPRGTSLRRTSWLLSAALAACLVPFATSAGPKGPEPEQEVGVLANQDVAAVLAPLFATEGKLELALQGIVIPNDPYVFGAQAGLAATYYLRERTALDFQVSFGDGAETFESLKLQEYGVQVDSYTPRLISSLVFQWTPIYAKLNLLGRRVVHFDTSLIAGPAAFIARRTIYNNTEAAEDANRFNLPASVCLGLSQRYFVRVSRQMAAIRVDARDYLYVLTTLEGTSAVKHNWYFAVGVSWFLPLGEQGRDR